MKLHDQFDAICFGVCATVALTAVAIGCTARETAKDAYTVQSKACLVAYDTRPMQTACLEYVRNRWTEAGAPPATQGDAGHD